MSTAYLTPPPLALPQDDPFVFHACLLRRGFVLEETARYSDEVWRLLPIQHKEHERAQILNFPSLPARFQPAAKRLFYHLLSGPLPDGEGRPEVMSVRGYFTGIKRFLVWLDKRWPADRVHLSELTGRDLDDYRKHLLIVLPDKPVRRASLRSNLRVLWRWRVNLGPDALLFDPRHLDGWGDPAKRTDRENATPRLPEEVLGPLLGWALRFIDDFADDILRADQQWWQMRSEQRTTPYKRGEIGVALRRLLDEYVAQGRPLPSYKGKPNYRLLGRLIQVGGTNPGDSLTGHQAEIDAALGQVGLAPTSHFPQAIRGLLDGDHWLPGIDTDHRDPHGLAGLARHLQAAAYTVVSFLSGIRDSEVKHMKRGCLHIQRDADGNAYRWKVASLAFKGEDDSQGVPAVWTVGEPVARAIAVLEALQPPGTDYLFARLAHGSGGKKGTRNAMVSSTTNKQLNAFVEWINQYCRRRDRLDGIPPVNKQVFKLKTGHFRRTLAWFIARRPGGVIAGALAFRHHSVQMFEGYAGTSDSGFRAEVESEQAMARGEVYIEMTEAHQHLDLGGPSAAEAAVRLKDFGERAQYQGKIALDRNRLQRIMKHNDPAIYPGEYITCVHASATALCEKAKRERAEGLPDHGGCLPLACRNVALTADNVLAWQRELGRLERRLAARPTLPPRLKFRLIVRHGDVAEFLTSNGFPAVAAA